MRNDLYFHRTTPYAQRHIPFAKQRHVPHRGDAFVIAVAIATVVAWAAGLFA